MKILMISLDNSILQSGSPSAKRMGEYGSICDELHIIVLKGNGAEKKELAKNVFAYGAGSVCRFFAIFKAISVGKKVLSVDGKWLITCQDPFETGFVGWRLSKRFNSGLEVQMHGDFYGNKYWKRENFLNFFRFYLGKFILKRANSVRAVSERIKNTIFCDNVFVLPIFSEMNVVANNPGFLKDKFLGAYPIILAVGNLVPVKNHKTLIETFADIKKGLPQAKLVIAGEGPLLKNFKSQISNLKLEQDVWLAGYQNNLADFYSSADIFVHPSFYEGWGRAVVEAAQFGLPVIMSDVGLAGEIIKNNESGLVVLVNNKKVLKEAIIKLVKDKDLQKKLAERAKEILKEKIPEKEKFLERLKESWGITF